jgi:hypothetical protein
MGMATSRSGVGVALFRPDELEDIGWNRTGPDWLWRKVGTMLEVR